MQEGSNNNNSTLTPEGKVIALLNNNNPDTFHVPGLFTLTLTRNENGTWTVRRRGTTRRYAKKKEKTKATYAAAKAVFDRIKADYLEEKIGSCLEDYEEEALAIVHENKHHYTGISIGLLLAIERISSIDKVNNIRRSLIRVLQEDSELPIANNPEEWRKWLDRAVAKIHTVKLSRHGIVTKAVDNNGLKDSTVGMRMQFFLRALKILVDFQHCFVGNGEYYAHQASISPGLIKYRSKFFKHELKPIESYEPLSQAEIKKYIESAPSMAAKLLILKTLAFGARPSDTHKLNSSFIVQNKVMLRELISKTKKFAHKIPNPEATLFIKVVLDVVPFLCLITILFQVYLGKDVQFLLQLF